MLGLGRTGEQKAAQFLKKKRYTIRETNYRSRFGEIDIIAEKEGVVVFVEVKTRKTGTFGAGLESVTRSKQQKLLKTAQFYTVEQNLQCVCRFDVISIDGSTITHIENAFGE